MTDQKLKPDRSAVKGNSLEPSAEAPAKSATGEVGGPEDYDSDPQAGGGQLPTHNPKPGTGGDAPSHNSR